MVSLPLPIFESFSNQRRPKISVKLVHFDENFTKQSFIERVLILCQLTYFGQPTGNGSFFNELRSNICAGVLEAKKTGRGTFFQKRTFFEKGHFFSSKGHLKKGHLSISSVSVDFHNSPRFL